VTKVEEADYASVNGIDTSAEHAPKSSKIKARNIDKASDNSAKRRCVSTACIACRKRKSKVRS